MNNGLYTKKITCPVCKNVFEVVKVMSSSTRAIKKDEDFCPYYEPINPLFYSVWICSECGYAAMEDKFANISDKTIKVNIEKIKPRWTPRGFSGERTINTALEVYKIALLNLQVAGAKGSELARMCIRIAWLYRYLNDTKEKEYLSLALNAYMDAFEKEEFPIENLDEITCMYMLGELNRRLGNFQEAAKWFFKVISGKNINSNNKAQTTYIINMAREQLQNLREDKQAAQDGVSK